jgi:hypothetical protein
MTKAHITFLQCLIVSIVCSCTDCAAVAPGLWEINKEHLITMEIATNALIFLCLLNRNI